MMFPKYAEELTKVVIMGEKQTKLWQMPINNS